MIVRRALGRLARVGLDPLAWAAMLTWPVFSLTAFQLVSRLKRRGVAIKTLVDVGANVGQFSVAVARLYPGTVIHAFEPIASCAAALRTNLNGTERADVYTVALGDRTGDVSLNINRHLPSSSILHLAPSHLRAFAGATSERVSTVTIETLDSVLGDLPLAPPVLLKLDVQGYESWVIKGGNQVIASCDHVLVETCFEPLYEGEATFHELSSLLDALGFSFDRPLDWLVHAGEIVQMDALFSRRAPE